MTKILTALRALLAPKASREVTDALVADALRQPTRQDLQDQIDLLVLDALARKA